MNEGQNHVILKQSASHKDQEPFSPLKNMALRIRKCRNLNFYDDAALFPELDLNQLFIKSITKKECKLSRYINGNQMLIKINSEYVKKVVEG